MKRIVTALHILVLCVLVSCSNDSMVEKMEQIKRIGDKDPATAMAMADSLEIPMRKASEYAKYRYDLLKIRLNTKLGNKTTSDIIINLLLNYFDENGTPRDKQEVNYFAGSEYRDLQDTPRAMAYFFKALEQGTTIDNCDSTLLRNTYANLGYLYYQVQDFTNSLKMSQKELDINRVMRKDVVWPFIHIGGAHLAMGNVEEVSAALDSAFWYIAHASKVNSKENQSALYYLLNDYAEIGDTAHAKQCHALITEKPEADSTSFYSIALAQYYDAIGNSDSCIYYYENVLRSPYNIFNLYDATKMLYNLHRELGNEEIATDYADIFMQLSDSLDLGKRQELAATVNNEYQYHLDQRKEQELKDEAQRHRNRLTWVSILFGFIACFGYIIYVRKKNIHLKQMLLQQAELQRVKDEEEKLKKDIAQKDQEIAERTSQNKEFIKMLHQTKFAGSAEDIIEGIRQASSGRRNMTANDWQQLYQAVDKLYPTFHEQLVQELGSFTEQQMQVCYLMRIGLANQQIQNLTDLSRVTVWRWTKKYEWVGISLSERL